MARPPTQTTTGLMLDRKAFDVALDRAAKNETRPKAENNRVIELLCELIKIYTEDTLKGQRRVNALRKTG